MSKLRFSPLAQDALEIAHDAAASWGHVLLTTGHILLGLLKTESSRSDTEDFATDILRRYRVDLYRVEHLLLHQLGAADELAPPRPLARETQDALEHAEHLRQELGSPVIRTEHLLAGLASPESSMVHRTLSYQLNRPTIQADIKLRLNRPVA